MKKSLLATMITSAIALGGCNSDSAIDSDNTDTSASPDINTIPVSSVTFDPVAGEISTPTDLLIDPQTGLLAVPLSGDIYDSLNSMDGWGLGSPISVDISFPGREFGRFSVDEGSLQDGGVILFDVSASALLNYGEDYTLASGSDGLVIIPLKPFKPASQYLMAVTNQVKDSLGRALTASDMYTLLSSSSTDMTQLTSDAAQQAQLAGIQALLTGINPVLSQFASDSTIVYSTRFTTQSVEPVMQAVMSQIVQSQPQIGSVTGASAVLAGQGLTVDDNKLSTFLTATGQDALTVAAATAAHDPDIYYGGMQLPYFLETPTAANCALQLLSSGSCDALGSHWVADEESEGSLRPGLYTPKKRSDHTVQVLISVPDEDNLPAGVSKPESGWPVVLYVHGVTSYKETIFAMAGNLAAQGIAVVAIDQPLHGSRSVDMDGDGVYEISTTTSSDPKYANGTSLVYANLGSLRTVRDNLRQSAADMLSLRAALSFTPVMTDAQLNPVSGIELDSDRVSMLGVSLGSMVGASTLGMSDVYDADGDGVAESDENNPFDFNAAVLAVGGTQSAAVMGYSNEFGPIVKEAFKQNDAFAAGVAETLGYTQEAFIALRTTDPATYDSLANVAYPSFLKAFVSGAQQAVDAGDPLVWAGKVASDTPVLVTQIVGNGVNLADQTVPNTLTSEGFPLAGTAGLINTLGLSQVSGSAVSADALKVYSNFLLGKHSSLLDPSHDEGVTQDALSALAATTEMQTQAISFIASQGQSISISNTNVIQ